MSPPGREVEYTESDVIDVFASLFEAGPTKRFLQFPIPWRSTSHHDLVLRDGEPVGTSRMGAYTYNERAMLSLAMLPDVDHRLPLISHRGVTHTLVFAALVGGVFAVVGALAGGALGPVVGDPPVGTDGVLAGVGLAGFGFVLGALTVCTHLLGDVLTPSGVALLWPLSNRRYTLGVTPAKSRLANYGLLAAGLAAVGAAAWLAVTV